MSSRGIRASAPSLFPMTLALLVCAGWLPCSGGVSGTGDDGSQKSPVLF